jgi:hypothetical protein
MSVNIQEEINKKTIPVFRRYGVIFAGLFGSRVRGDARPQGDYDFIVRFKNTPSLVKLIKMENELKSVLRSKVDVIIEGSEKPFIKQNLEKELAPIYGQRFAV